MLQVFFLEKLVSSSLPSNMNYTIKSKNKNKNNNNNHNNNKNKNNAEKKKLSKLCINPRIIMIAKLFTQENGKYTCCDHSGHRIPVPQQWNGN